MAPPALRSSTFGSLYKETGLFTFDPGYTATGACESKVTYIDGDNGVLQYRGYPIEQLAEHSNYMEVCYLLMNGELPNAAEYKNFEHTITNHTMVHDQLANFFRGFRRDAHPMAILCGVVGALSAFYHDSTDIEDPHHRMVASHRLIAKMPTIAAMAHKYSIGQPFMYPKNDLGYAANFLHMCHAVPAEDYKVDPIVAKALDLIFHPARRSRAERRHLHRASGRLHRCQPVRLYRCRLCCAVGSVPMAARTKKC